ncbi:hypothetical protein B0H13DRAFT_2322451 [Mycena leptocephala]|nr:hypothetical protein B0H13DRAFT_2322451 [Mycena leptocephala]
MYIFVWDFSGRKRTRLIPESLQRSKVITRRPCFLTPRPPIKGAARSLLAECLTQPASEIADVVRGPLGHPSKGAHCRPPFPTKGAISLISPTPAPQAAIYRLRRQNDQNTAFATLHDRAHRTERATRLQRRSQTLSHTHALDSTTTHTMPHSRPRAHAPRRSRLPTVRSALPVPLLSNSSIVFWEAKDDHAVPFGAVPSLWLSGHSEPPPFNFCLNSPHLRATNLPSSLSFFNSRPSHLPSRFFDVIATPPTHATRIYDAISHISVTHTG